MFSFEELGLLEAKSLQKIMQTVELRTLVVALKTASESLKEVFLSALSRRAAENMREELQLTESLKLREVEAAQLEIVDAAKRLETEGEIDLSDLRPQFKSF
jgi:flagellar motor switch protein FliG